MNNEPEELSASEQQALAGLSREKMPPTFVEDQVVEHLRAANLIRDSRFAWLPSYQKLAVAFAFSLALFLCGAILGARLRSTANNDPRLAGFMLIVRGAPPKFASVSAEDHQQRVNEYTAWAFDLEQRGLLLGGEELKNDAMLLRPRDNDASVSEEHTNAAEGTATGYFLLPASNYEQALKVARTCPHLKHGGTVELREIAH
ncbi:MAG TPA: hypothetical protein VLL54_08195 [Pyrinomonadaceae bacterium]|nr:hypothetical protein [Pyrinomonadaceae bacterium]